MRCPALLQVAQAPSGSRADVSDAVDADVCDAVDADASDVGGSDAGGSDAEMRAGPEFAGRASGTGVMDHPSTISDRRATQPMSLALGGHGERRSR